MLEKNEKSLKKDGRNKLSSGDSIFFNDFSLFDHIFSRI